MIISNTRVFRLTNGQDKKTQLLFMKNLKTFNTARANKIAKDPIKKYTLVVLNFSKTKSLLDEEMLRNK